MDSYVELHNTGILYEVSMTSSHNGEPSLSHNFPPEQKPSDDLLPTRLLRIHVCGLQIAVMTGLVLPYLHYQFTFCCLFVYVSSLTYLFIFLHFLMVFEMSLHFWFEGLKSFRLQPHGPITELT